MNVEALALTLIVGQVSLLLVISMRNARSLGRVLSRLEEHERRITRLELGAHPAHARAAGADSSAAG